MSEWTTTVVAVWSALLMVLLNICPAAVYGGTFDPCPEGVEPGDSWEPEADLCLKCICFTDMPGYGCYSCRVNDMVPRGPGCYVTRLHLGAPYPQCCDVQQRCPGDVDYNPDHSS